MHNLAWSCHLYFKIHRYNAIVVNRTRVVFILIFNDFVQCKLKIAQNDGTIIYSFGGIRYRCFYWFTRMILILEYICRHEWSQWLNCVYTWKFHVSWTSYNRWSMLNTNVNINLEPSDRFDVHWWQKSLYVTCHSYLLCSKKMRTLTLWLLKLQ